MKAQTCPFILFNAVTSSAKTTTSLYLKISRILKFIHLAILNSKYGLRLMVFNLKYANQDSPVCRNRWFLRLVCLLKPRLQTWHLNGHDPLCTYMCDLRSPGVGNDLEHSAHLCGFSCGFEHFFSKLISFVSILFWIHLKFGKIFFKKDFLF